jgi:2-polyprenyl-6-hydroxyphenyl methylase/3-demethylubiquinone-9 3-methyltransferase
MTPAKSLDAPSIDPEEIAYFENLAYRWWDAEGPFWPLHRLNVFRVGYVREHLSGAFGSDPAAEDPLEGLHLLDIGSGGGILSESMARLGARVTGIEVTEKSVQVAKLHARRSALDIDYRLAAAEDLVKTSGRFDAVLNMEVVEHIEHLSAFLPACGELVRPGGLMVVATINRTLAALLIAIVGAEYVLGWMPKGTHHWRKLVRPSEVIAGLGKGFKVIDRTGVRINPFDRCFHFSRYMGVNYMMVLRKAAT